MTNRHKLISVIGATVFTAGFFALSLLNDSAQQTLQFLPKGVAGAAIVAAVMLVLTLALFFPLRHRTPVTLALCFIPVTALWIACSEGRTWIWIAAVSAVIVILFGTVRWPEARNSTISWAGAGLMGVVLALCAALATLTIR